MEYAEKLMLADVLYKLSSLSQQVLWNPWSLYGKRMSIVLKGGETFSFDDYEQPYGFTRLIANKIGNIVLVRIGEEQYDIEDYMTKWLELINKNVLLPLGMINKEYHIGALPFEIVGKQLLKQYKEDVLQNFSRQYLIFFEETRLLRNII